MGVTVVMTSDAQAALDWGHSFLVRDPVRHNVVLTVLSDRARHPQPGRYWLATDRTAAGVVLQSPTDFSATLGLMAPHVVSAVVDAIVEEGVMLPGVNGQAEVAARFAGHWSAAAGCAAVPVQGERLYEIVDVMAPRGVRGQLRRARCADRMLVVEWLRAFHDETGGHAVDVEAVDGDCLAARCRGCTCPSRLYTPRYAQPRLCQGLRS
jgi:hypothetical protein